MAKTGGSAQSGKKITAPKAASKKAGGWRPVPLNSGEPVLDNQDAGIQLTYDLLDSAMKQNSSVVKGQYHGAKHSVRSAYDAGADYLKDASNTLQSQLGGQISMLGLDAAKGNALADIQSGLAGALGDNAQMRTADLSALNSMQQADYGVARQGVLGANREKAQQQVDARNSLQKVLLEQRAQEEMARAEVEIARINAQAARAAAAEARSGGGGGGSGDSQDALEAEYQGLRNMKLMQELGLIEGPPGEAKEFGPGDYGSGNLGLQRYYQNGGFKGGLAGPTFQSSIQRLIDTSRNLKPTRTGDKKDPYEWAMRNAGRYNALNPQKVQTALQIYFNRSR